MVARVIGRASFLMSDTQTLDTEENPSWVLELPDADEIEPPTDTLEQELPFGRLRDRKSVV